MIEITENAIAQAEQVIKNTHPDKRVPIYVGSNYKIYEASEKALQVLVAANDPPKVFVRGNTLAHITRSKETGEPVIQVVSEDILSTILNRTCNFFVYGSKTDEDGDKVKLSKNPPREVVKDFLYNISENKFQGLPLLRGITRCPIINNKGEIQIKEGYNTEYKLVYIPDKNLNVSVPTVPTNTDVDTSIKVIEDILTDFPFCDQRNDDGSVDGKASRANMIGAFIASAIPSLMYDKFQPMITITKPTQGTGSSFLCRMVGIIQNGIEPRMLEMPSKREEWSKTLLSCAIEGWSAMMFDNVDGTLYSPELAMSITQMYQSGRVLGISQMAQIKFMPMWMANGINITLSGDMPRRCVSVNLDAGVEMPWLRSEWTHSDIIGYTVEHRGKIISAILTIVRAWIQKGKPKPHARVPQLQGFTEWRDIIGGVLSIIPNGEQPFVNEKHETEIPTHGCYFLTNLMDMYEKSDVGRGQWSEFMVEWHKIWGMSWTNLSEIVRVIENAKENGGEIRYCLPEEITNQAAAGKDISRVMGRALHKQMDRVYRLNLYDGKFEDKTNVLMKFEHQEIRHKSRWRLTETFEKKKDAQTYDNCASTA